MLVRAILPVAFKLDVPDVVTFVMIDAVDG
jgi:hypothetical protein